MESFFVALIIVAVVVAVLSMIENHITRNLYRQRYELDKHGYIKILVPGVPLPCYIYHAGQSDFIKSLPNELRTLYEKRIIPTHISAAIQKRLKNTKHCAQDIFTVGDPINSIVKTVSNAMSLINDSDPTQSDPTGKWRIFKPIGYKVNCFTDKEFLYIM
jgi:hypothetical protein